MSNFVFNETIDSRPNWFGNPLQIIAFSVSILKKRSRDNKPAQNQNKPSDRRENTGIAYTQIVVPWKLFGLWIPEDSVDFAVSSASNVECAVDVNCEVNFDCDIKELLLMCWMRISSFKEK